MALDDLLARCPSPLREALAGADPVWAADMARRYLEADEDSKADMLAFVCSGGPDVVAEETLKLVDGVPTSMDLASAAGQTLARRCPSCQHQAHGAGDYACPCGCGSVL